MNRSSADRLRRLRLVLTAMFTVMNAIGLIVFAWLVVDMDHDRGEQRMDLELSKVTSTVVRLINRDGDAVVTGLITRDEINGQCPQFAVLPGDTGGTFEHFSGRDCVRMNPAVLHGLAADATRTGREVYGYKSSLDGQKVRVRAQPFQGESGYLGAVVAVVDAEPTLGEHDRLVLFVVLGTVVLIGSLALAGHLLAGRAIRPAVGALEQQEVLLAETAHDLRTPVAALRALAETALRNPAQRAELLPRTVRLAARMGSIIDGLLVRARLAAGVERLAMQPVWLDQLVTGVVEETPAEGASVTVTAAPCKVMADPTLLQRAVGNLLGNALRYGRQPNQPAIVHISVAGGRVTVADHGPGVSSDFVEEAFDRFRTSSGGPGVGLGLSIVRWVATAHGGTLSVYNAEDAGAIFELALPVLP
ncbi:sensor histidine kinase [Actinophytocola sp. NPDC049390]|uniref:sensor histidine kinase n=1 Tax=Actinophytocola sp. NPDC049390 TaxID=3363894 RepID=UPI003787C6B1